MNELFILCGSKNYDDRGFESVVRGTVDIIRRYYEEPRFVVCGPFSSLKQFRAQEAGERDHRIRHARVRQVPQGRGITGLAFSRMYRLFSGLRAEYRFREIVPLIPEAEALLALGGSLEDLCDFDRVAGDHGRKVMVWGASIGPFPTEDAEKTMARRLNSLPGIFCRESGSLEYLRRIGVEKNVFLVCDPAYAVMQEEPVDSALYGDLSRSIGINLGPAVPLDDAVQIVKSVASLGNPVLLLPYVLEPGNDDLVFLKQVAARLPGDDITLVTANHNSEELKWFIARLRLFCGWHTHACIAGLTSHVPTVSLCGSPEMVGINMDIFGHRGYCIEKDNFNPLSVILAVTSALCNREYIIEVLERRMGDMVWDAYKNGKLLKSICLTQSRLPSSTGFFRGFRRGGGRIKAGVHSIS